MYLCMTGGERENPKIALRVGQPSQAKPSHRAQPTNHTNTNTYTHCHTHTPTCIPQRLPAQRGWTVLSRGFEGWTPLIIAGYNGCPAVLRCLLAHRDAHLDGTDEKGATALWWAAVHNRPEAVR